MCHRVSGGRVDRRGQYRQRAICRMPTSQNRVAAPLPRCPAAERCSKPEAMWVLTLYLGTAAGSSTASWPESWASAAAPPLLGALQRLGAIRLW